MNPQLRVAVDVGCYRHRVAIGLSEGTLLEEFEISHDGPGLNEFFTRVDRQAQQWGRPVAGSRRAKSGGARWRWKSGFLRFAARKRRERLRSK